MILKSHLRKVTIPESPLLSCNSEESPTESDNTRESSPILWFWRVTYGEWQHQRVLSYPVILKSHLRRLTIPESPLVICGLNSHLRRVTIPQSPLLSCDSEESNTESDNTRESSRNLWSEQSPTESDNTTESSPILWFWTVTYAESQYQSVLSYPVILKSHLRRVTIPESPPVTCVLNSHLKRMTIPDAVLIQLSSWRWAQYYSKHVEECNKCIKINNLCIKLVNKRLSLY